MRATVGRLSHVTDHVSPSCIARAPTTSTATIVCVRACLCTLDLCDTDASSVAVCGLDAMVWIARPSLSMQSTSQLLRGDRRSLQCMCMCDAAAAAAIGDGSSQLSTTTTTTMTHDPVAPSLECCTCRTHIQCVRLVDGGSPQPSATDISA